MLERLQKVISMAGIASRREAEKLIVEGKVRVNGKLVTELGTKVDSKRDKIYINGKPINIEKKVYILFNKPKGVVTTVKDPEGRKTVIDFMKNISERVYPVGRLDYNTEGLLLLTNDGELTNILTHPRHNINKTYEVTVDGIVEEEKLDKLRAGIKLDDGMTAPAVVQVLNYDYETQRTKFSIIIHEGRNRQVRRMCEAIGYRVRNLKRTKFAFLTLTGLRRGQYRHLTLEEIELLKNLAAE